MGALKFKSNLYIQGKFGKWYSREVLNSDSIYLYEEGKRKCRVTEDKLPEYYCKFHSKSIWYTNGWVNTKGVKYIHVKCTDNNHYRKDDYLYISYDRPVSLSEEGFFTIITNYDYVISGYCIDDIISYIMKYSPECNCSYAIKELKRKDRFLKKNYPTELNHKKK